MTTNQKLWEAEHSYYCSDTNYFSNDCYTHYKRWQDFIESEGDADFDYNLVFRWDWSTPEDEEENEINWQGDENYRDCRLDIFWIGQRKGLFRCTSIDVCRADEPSVKEWLSKRWKHLKGLWAPINDSTEPPRS